MLAIFMAQVAQALPKDDYPVERDVLGIGISLVWIVIILAVMIGIAFLPVLFRKQRR